MIFWNNLLTALSWVSLVFAVLSLTGVAILDGQYEKSGEDERRRRNRIQGYVYWALLPLCIGAVMTWGWP